MFFSPVAERSKKVMALFSGFYALLSMGSVAIVIPLIIMLAGSAEPGVRYKTAFFLPAYLLNDRSLWERYLEAKYRNETDLLRMAWGDNQADFDELPPPRADPEIVSMWEAFVTETVMPPQLFGAGFSGLGKKVAYYNNREFRQWLMRKYGSIGQLNAALETSFRSYQEIDPPFLYLIGGKLNEAALGRDFLLFCKEGVPPSQKFAWDAGGYFRGVFLPRMEGEDVAEYNARYGTAYRSYSEVPFPATVPHSGAGPWTIFVTKFLRPDFVELTDAGKKRWKASGTEMHEFIRLSAKPEDVRVITADCKFSEWAWKRGNVRDVRIPQYALDSIAFEKEKGFWKWQFITQNYCFVFDEICIQGRAMANTLILVLLKVSGALLVNPLAAYGLSRFKLKHTYVVLLVFLATIAFPAEVTMIPVFLQLRELNMLNTFWSLVLPGLVNGFSIFLLKGFFDSLPRELYEAAELDGASEWKMFWIITMSLSKPILAILALNAFVTAYGAFFYALILCPDPKMWTVMVYIYQLQSFSGLPVVYASLILTAIPTLLVFVFCQNLILRGIVVPSEK